MVHERFGAAWDPGQRPRRRAFHQSVRVPGEGGSQQVIGHVHEQAQVAGGVLAEGLQKRRVHELGITGDFEQVVQALEQLGRGQGFGAQSARMRLAIGKRWASSRR